MQVKGIGADEAARLGKSILERVGLQGMTGKYPSTLSGGQQQRVAIARSLAMQPKIMLYDEPTSALDPRLVDEVFNVMRELNNEKMTQIVVTHDSRFARDVTNRVLAFEDGKATWQNV
jgi:polar amino acid transport system ATP-binding protein